MFNRLFSSARMYFSICTIVLLALCLSMVVFMTLTPYIAPNAFTDFQYQSYLVAFTVFIVFTGLKMLFTWVAVTAFRGGAWTRLTR